MEWDREVFELVIVVIFINLELEKKEEDWEVRISFGYIVSERLNWVIYGFVLKKS